LLRAFEDIVAAGASPREAASLAERARRVVSGCEQALPAYDVEALQGRLARLEAQVMSLSSIATRI